MNLSNWRVLSKEVKASRKLKVNEEKQSWTFVIGVLTSAFLAVVVYQYLLRPIGYIGEIFGVKTFDTLPWKIASLAIGFFIFFGAYGQVFLKRNKT